MKFDHDRLLAAFGGLQDATAAASDSHRTARPAVPADVAGQAYPATAARLNAALERLHRAGQVRIDALHADSVAGARQVSALYEADRNFSARLLREVP